MEDKNDVLTAAAIIISSTVAALKMEQKKKRKNKNHGLQLGLQKRNQERGVLNMLNLELKAYTNFLRLTNPQFEQLLGLIEGDIKCQETFMRNVIPARSKLEVTLQFLATGESY
ncbi:hypothetical protein FQA39_LY07352 [Lamprigera yunnana]|nr:hypothetical protein FQA39_LY07352 [Lamprigera yunnana]